MCEARDALTPVVNQVIESQGLDVTGTVLLNMACETLAFNLVSNGAQEVYTNSYTAFLAQEFVNRLQTAFRENLAQAGKVAAVSGPSSDARH